MNPTCWGSMLVDDGFCYSGASHSAMAGSHTSNSELESHPTHRFTKDSYIFFKKGKDDPGLPM